jgi:PPK2 family polyphosphate:nucleotide phosphotransferase
VIANHLFTATQADAGQDFVAAAGEDLKHTARLSVINRFAEDLAGGHHRGIGRQDDLIGRRLDRAGLGFGEASHVRAGAFTIERRLIHLGDAHGEGDAGVVEDLTASRRLAGKDEHRYVELSQMKRLSKELLVAPGSKVKLSGIDAGDTHGVAKAAAETAFEKIRDRLSVLQYMLYADGQRALLVVLQGIDAAGKDGTIRNVMSGLNPQGVRVTSFKAPDGAEKRHDYLWRVHNAVPESGQIGIFNRSHYEDVLIVRVHNLVPKSVWSQRYAQINEFERMLSQNRVRIVKFLLYIDKDEQAKRFRERIADPAKNWKFSEDDLKEREYWDQYLEAYEKMLRECSTDYAPWYLIPANRKWFRNLAVAQILRDELEAMDLKSPKPVADLSGITFE